MRRARYCNVDARGTASTVHGRPGASLGRLMLLRYAVLLALALLSWTGSPPRLAGGDAGLPETRGARLAFIPPPAGSYILQHIQPVPDGLVLDSDGRSAPLTQFTTGRVTLLAFMYTYCSDPVGCPLAYATFMAMRERLLPQPALARRVRLVSLSFDPSNDTPDAMARYAGPLAAADATVRWHFLTTASTSALRPIVDGLDQSVRVQHDSEGRPTRFFDHMLKVFLIDAQGDVREIYSTAFLQPEVMFNDVLTLLGERPASAAQAGQRHRQRRPGQRLGE